MRYLWWSRDDIKSLHKLYTCCQWWCGRSHVCLGHENCQNLHLGRTVQLLSIPEVVGCVPPSLWHQSIEHHHFLTKFRHAALDRFGECARHPAGFVIVARRAQLSSFIINLIIPILLFVRPWRSLRLSPIAFVISSNVFTTCLDVDPTIPAFLISSSSRLIAVSASWTRFLATVVSLSR